MMAIVVEIYHADLLPHGGSVPQSTHVQAFAAACAGFLPAFLCLQRLNSGSWSQAVRFTAPWSILLLDAIVTVAARLQWYWALVIAIPLAMIAYRIMLRTARGLAKT